jgi:hypothetical protein
MAMEDKGITGKPLTPLTEDTDTEVDMVMEVDTVTDVKNCETCHALTMPIFIPFGE